jgi:hypothetical protein
MYSFTYNQQDATLYNILYYSYTFQAVSIHTTSGICQACLTYTRCCVCTVFSSWWWAEKPPETRTALTVIKNIVQHCILFVILKRSVTTLWLETPEMNNIQQYTLPTYAKDTRQASTKSCTYKNHNYIPCDQPQVNNTDLTCYNTAPHNCPHVAQHSEAKSVHINNSITVLWPQCIKPLQVPIFLFCVLLLLALKLSPYYQSYREIIALSEWILF